MKTLRHYFISNDLDDLEVFEEQLEADGVETAQIHVFSLDDTEVEHHKHLHEVQSLAKKDVVNSTGKGAVIGVCGAVLVVFVAYYAGWTESPAGWIPFIFLSVIVLGFCTWEGGLIGIETPNQEFLRFEDALNDGKHIFFVDLTPDQESVLEKILKSHPKVELAGTGDGVPDWLISLEGRFGMVRHS